MSMSAVIMLFGVLKITEFGTGQSEVKIYAMHRGGCLELYYCNMVEWSWWDSSLILKTNWLISVL